MISGVGMLYDTCEPSVPFLGIKEKKQYLPRDIPKPLVSVPIDELKLFADTKK